MNNSHYRNTVIAAAIAATLGLGAAGCSKTPDSSSRQATSNQGSASQGVTDASINTGLKAKLATERNLDSSDISVSTSNGTVTLTGTVNDTTARSAAETVARSFAGVTNVNNRLTVRDQTTGQSRASGQGQNVATTDRNTGSGIAATGDAAQQAMSDTWITTKIKSVLLADSEAKGLDVKVDTKDGVVTLEGTLANQAAVDHVVALARDVEGVKRVNATALTATRR